MPAVSKVYRNSIPREMADWEMWHSSAASEKLLLRTTA